MDFFNDIHSCSSCKGSLVSNNTTDTVHLADLKRRRYWFPLMVWILLCTLFIVNFFQCIHYVTRGNSVYLLCRYVWDCLFCSNFLVSMLYFSMLVRSFQVQVWNLMSWCNSVEVLGRWVKVWKSFGDVQGWILGSYFELEGFDMEQHWIF